ncbi:MAG: M3 family metallopeptidase [Puniceicoccales bacterium]|jgi:oligopeptidase A|nr:M3 family metallopeptidase [Puniceicoccales bacterium]
MTTTHPLLNPEFHIRWSQLTPESIATGIPIALRNATAALKAIASQPPGQVTFANTFLALEKATRELNLAWGKVEHINSVNNTPAFRRVYNRLLPQVTAFTTSITLDPRLWTTLQTAAATPALANLTGTERRLIDETLSDFIENGATLPPKGKKRLAAINAQLATLTQKYAENVLDAINAWEKLITDPSALDGLPASALATLAANARATGHPDGTWRITLHAPVLTPVLQYAHNDALRRECWEASTRIGTLSPWDNTPLIWQILGLRHEKAVLLGKKSFADLATARRMAKTGQTALNFIEDLHQRIQPHFERETAGLETFRQNTTHSPTPTPLSPWESAYWAERQRRAKHDYDPEALRPYFPIDGVIQRMFSLFGPLFGIRVHPRPTTHTDPATGRTTTHTPTEPALNTTPVEVWHPEVKYYEIHDNAPAQTPRHLGSFYTDWHPRATKRDGAWMNHLITGTPRHDGTLSPHLGLICGNFTPPINGHPPHLTHDEVLTLFHEFGHLLHHLLTTIPYESLAGTRVAWDFVELPSQLLENWCWHKTSLPLIARHHATGEPPPPGLVEKLTQSTHYRAATHTLRQLALAKLDLELHHHYDQHRHAPSLAHVWQHTLAAYHPRTTPPTPPITNRFTHIFGDPTGYAAGYYSYKWAETLEADAFTRFEHDGVLNEKTGRELRDKILAKGNSAPPEKLYHDFMGRTPDPAALLRRQGLAQALPA